MIKFKLNKMKKNNYIRGANTPIKQNSELKSIEVTTTEIGDLKDLKKKIKKGDKQFKVKKLSLWRKIINWFYGFFKKIF